MKRLLLILLAVLAAALLLIQLVPVERDNPPVEETVEAPAEVMTVLRRSCFDCHSHETVWPWYSYVAPVSWLVADDVHHGREHLNFSAWNRYDAEERADLFEEIAEEVERGNMPLPLYLRAHPEARLSAAEVALIVEWAGGAAGEAEAAEEAAKEAAELTEERAEVAAERQEELAEEAAERAEEAAERGDDDHGRGRGRGRGRGGDRD